MGTKAGGRGAARRWVAGRVPSASSGIRRLPLANVLGYIAQLADVKVRADRWAIVFFKPAESDKEKDSKGRSPGAK